MIGFKQCFQKAMSYGLKVGAIDVEVWQLLIRLTIICPNDIKHSISVSERFRTSKVILVVVLAKSKGNGIVRCYDQQRITWAIKPIQKMV